jgi:hypothetical protein
MRQQSMGADFQAADPIWPHGSLNIFALKAPFWMARLLVLMELDGPSSVICCSAVVNVCVSRLTCCTSMAKISECCHSSREKRC